MQEDKAIYFQELDQILYNAQLRRSADLGAWLRQYLEHRQARQQREKLNAVTTLHRPAV
jgi:hypothetical protein